MSDHVWSPGEADADRYDLDLGSPDYEKGTPISIAFSISTVFKAGLSMLNEQPMLLLLAGANLWLAQMVPSIIKMPVDIYLETITGLGQMDDMTKTLLSTLLGLGITLMFLPLQQLVAAGGLISLANAIRNDQTNYGVMYTSVRAALMNFLYSLLVGLIGGLATLALFTPGIAIGAALIYNGSPEIGLLAMLLGMLLAIIPSIYITLGLQLGTYAVVLDDASPLEAISLSWAAAEGNRITLFLLNLVAGVAMVIASLGTCCLFGAGMIPVQGVVMTGMASAWLLYARDERESRAYPFIARHLPEI